MPLALACCLIYNAHFLVPCVCDRSGDWIHLVSNRRAWRPYNIRQLRTLVRFPTDEDLRS